MLCGDWIASVKFSLPERLRAILPRAPVATVRAETSGLRLDECEAAPRGLWHCSHSASTLVPARAYPAPAWRARWWASRVFPRTDGLVQECASGNVEFGAA